jgi:hypothetical protein
VAAVHSTGSPIENAVAVFIAPGGIPIWFDHESVNQVIGDSASVSV